MVSEIRIYVEGGGDAKDAKARLRQGFHKFFKDVVSVARSKGIRWRITPCGPRNDAHKNFVRGLKSHPTSFNLLLVDSEGPLQSGSWEHLRNRDQWSSEGTGDQQCHLMVQTMEAWLVADIDALTAYYGQGFAPNAIPGQADVEQIPKDQLFEALKSATRNTTKGEYHKGRHAPQLLERLNVPKVRTAAMNCEQLFRTLEQQLAAAL